MWANLKLAHFYYLKYDKNLNILFIILLVNKFIFILYNNLNLKVYKKFTIKQLEYKNIIL